MPNETTIQGLVKRWKDVRGTVKNNSSAVRVHRALSWLKRADTCKSEDEDIGLLCRWIAFNALYGQWDMGARAPLPDRECWQHFTERILELDGDELLVNTIRRQDKAIRKIYENKYLNKSLWEEHELRGGEHRDQWVLRYEQWRAKKNWRELVNVLFDRIYLLRCQMVHGAATYDSMLNRKAVRSCNTVLTEMIVAVCLVILDHGLQEDWGIMCYPPSPKNVK